MYVICIENNPELFNFNMSISINSLTTVGHIYLSQRGNRWEINSMTPRSTHSKDFSSNLFFVFQCVLLRQDSGILLLLHLQTFWNNVLENCRCCLQDMSKNPKQTNKQTKHDYNRIPVSPVVLKSGIIIY